MSQKFIIVNLNDQNKVKITSSPPLATLESVYTLKPILPSTSPTSATSVSSDSNDACNMSDSDDDSMDEPFKTGDATKAPKRRRLTNLSADEKLQRRKLKNRIAAQSARDRKKVKMDDLEKRVKELADENAKLKKQNKSLEESSLKLANENASLKSELSSVADQRCGELKRRHSGEVKRIECTLSGESAEFSNSSQQQTLFLHAQRPHILSPLVCLLLFTLMTLQHSQPQSQQKPKQKRAISFTPSSLPTMDKEARKRNIRTNLLRILKMIQLRHYQRQLQRRQLTLSMILQLILQRVRRRKLQF